MKLEIAAWLEIIEDLLDHSSVVFEACDDCSSMDVIKWLREVPVVLCVVDFEFTVRRDTLGL